MSIENVDQLVEAWDRGENIPAVSLGGMGKGYEMAIQALLIELVRDMRNQPMPEGDKKKWEVWGDSTIHRLAEKWGFSGAQVGAAKSTAFQYLKYGFAEMMKTAPADRLLVINSNGIVEGDAE